MTDDRSAETATSASSGRRVVVVTGASSGIGRATAIAFAEDGADLVLVARGVAALESTALACRHRGARVLVHPADVGDMAQVRAVADAAIARHGGIDVWANLVGVGAVGRFDTVPVEAHRRVVESNLMGHIHGAHAALGHFRDRGRGVLINMISVGGFVATPYAAAYGASKFALRGLGESLRGELGRRPRIHVCDVYPTFVDTPAIGHAANHTGRKLAPPPPLVDPKTVARRIVRLSHAPRPTTVIGSVGLPARLAHALAPNWLALATGRAMEAALRRADPVPTGDGNLFEASRGTASDGGHRARRAHGTAAWAGAAAIGLTAAVGLGWWARRRNRGD